MTVSCVSSLFFMSTFGCDTCSPASILIVLPLGSASGFLGMTTCSGGDGRQKGRV